MKHSIVLFIINATFFFSRKLRLFLKEQYYKFLRWWHSLSEIKVFYKKGCLPKNLKDLEEDLDARIICMLDGLKIIKKIF